MSLHPLIDLANDREVKQAKGFRAVAASLSGEKLETLYKGEADSAPNRAEAGKKYLGVRTGRIPTAPQTGKGDRHAAMALGTWSSAGDGLIEIPGGLQLQLLGSLVPLRTAAPDKARGEEDINRGVEDVDALGILSDDRLAVVRIKFLPADAKRGGAGDTPLRTFLSGLAQVAMVDANRAGLAAEIEGLTGRTLSDEAPVLVVAGSPRYWEICRKREAQKGAAWIRELDRLGREASAQIGVEVFYLGLLLEGEPEWSYGEAGPVLVAAPGFGPAWEIGAGKLKPKAKSKSRKSDPADEIVEADLSRPPRSYSISESYEPGDQIVHPNLGTGVVQSVAGLRKISVLFGEEAKLLVHERPARSA